MAYQQLWKDGNDEIDQESLDFLRAIKANPSLLADATEDQQLAITELHHRALRGSLLYFAENTSHRFCDDDDDPTPQPHHLVILYWLDKLARGEIKRLMLFVPPSHAKSTYAIRIMVPWWMQRNQKGRVLMASSSQLLVLKHSEVIQGMIRDHKDVFKMDHKRDNKAYWDTDSGCEVRAASSGEDIQGFRGGLIMGDDLVGGIADVKSDKERDNLWDWYDANLHSRLKNVESRICLINTRWHEDDICGRILRIKGREGWKIVNLPAVWESEEDEPAFPEGLGRKYGEPLWPIMEPLYVESRKGAELKFQSLYQGNPLPPGGAQIKADLIKPVDAVRHAKKICRGWDLAATRKRGSDYTVGVLMQKDERGHFTILDVIRFQGGPEEVRSTVINTAIKDGKSCSVIIPKDPGQAGVVQALDYTTALAGYNVTTPSNTGSKEDRAAPMAAQINGENFSMMNNQNFYQMVIDELKGFPNLAHDDIVDAAATAFSGLIEPTTRVKPPRWSTNTFRQR